MIRIILTLTVLCCSAASAQFGAITDAAKGAAKRVKGTGKNDPNQQQNANTAQQAVAAAEGPVVEDEGTVQSYIEMRTFAEGLYHQLEGSGSDVRASDFKRRVDRAYEQYRQSDMQKAYEMNTHGESRVQRVIEDRFRVYEGLYDNPIVQMYANRVGQSIIPSYVGRLYTFKLIAHPVPSAEPLSTGTVWVSTGLVSMVNTKAELAYILAHEAAHVYLNHHRQRILLNAAGQEYNRQLQENGENRVKRYTLWGGIAGAAAGVAVGQAAGGSPVGGAVGGGLLGAAAGGIFASATNRRFIARTEWNRFEEDEADRLAFDWLLAAKLNVSEVPRVFLALADAGSRDPRMTLGFLGRQDRLRERMKAINARLAHEKAQPEWSKIEWNSADSDFDLLLAEVKRDNGVFAFHHDMFDTALDNLKYAASKKTQDPTALYFYAKVLSQTARTDEQRKTAEDYFRRASEVDYRNQNYGSFLHRAVVLLTAENANAASKKQAVELLKRYVLGYHFSAADDEAASSRNYPPHLEAVYDYMSRAGEYRWAMDQRALDEAAKARAKGVLLVDYKDGDAKLLQDPQPKEKKPDAKPAKPVRSVAGTKP